MYTIPGDLASRFFLVGLSNSGLVDDSASSFFKWESFSDSIPSSGSGRSWIRRFEDDAAVIAMNSSFAW